MAYQKGDVILVPFPFTDLTAVKTRPAVVVSVDDYERRVGDLVVAMITSMPQTTPYDYELKDWKAANLLFPSWVRTKLVTINPALVRYRPGRLTDRDLQEVDKRLKMALGF